MRIDAAGSAVPGLMVAIAVLLIGLMSAFLIGQFPIGLGDIVKIVIAKLTGGAADVAPQVERVVLYVRGPRVLAAVMVGCALASAGAAFQGLFRNPLVSPDILGASSGAALGAVIGFYLSLDIFAIQALAFVGGLGAVALVYLIGARLSGRDPVLMLVLIGVVVGALLGAGVGLVKYIGDPQSQLPLMTFWLLGGLDKVIARDLLPLFVPIALGIAVLIALRWRMNAMSLPEEEARALGLPTGRLRLVIITAATLVTAVSVAAAGVVGWVGLVVPHIARALVGPDFSRLLPATAILGGGYLLLIDTLARSTRAGEIPLGILTAVVGTPFFLWLLTRIQRTWS
jgi:iron complex transport system permease protein